MSEQQNKNQGGGSKKPAPKGNDPLVSMKEEKLKKDTAVLTAEKNLAIAKANAKEFNGNLAELDKKIKKGEDKVKTVTLASTPILISSIFFIFLGLALGNSPEKTSSIYMLPFIFSGILLVPFGILAHKKKWRAEFFIVLIVSIIVGFVVMNLIPYKSLLTEKSTLSYTPNY